METTVQVSIPEDFRQACEIFNVKPVAVLQVIADKMSFPVFYSNQANKKKWAMLIFLDYLDQITETNDGDMEFHEPFMTSIIETAERVFEKSVNDPQAAEKAVRKVVDQWHREVLKRRSAYLLNDLPDMD